MEEISARRRLRRIVPRKRNDFPETVEPDRPNSAALPEPPAANTTISNSDVRAIPEQRPLGSNKLTESKAVTKTRNKSKSGDAPDQPKRIVRVRCKNCKTRFEFRTNKDVRYACRECGEMIHVSVKQHGRKWIVLLGTIVVVGAAIASASVML